MDQTVTSLSTGAPTWTNDEFMFADWEWENSRLFSDWLDDHEN